MALAISMLSQERTDVLKDASIRYTGFGKLDYTARCSKCGRMNTWKALDAFRIRGNIICEHCGHSMHIVIADSITHHADENFRLLRQQKIAIWPMVNVVEEMRRAVPSIMEDNVYFIDSAKLKQGAHFYNKIVQEPGIIDKEQIDTVFLTVTTSVATEIIEELKSFPSVKRIFFAGDLFNPDFPALL